MYYFIINPASKSGLGKNLWETLKKRLDEKKISYQYYFTKRPFHATKLVTEILQKEGIKHIIVIGGDGSLNEAANGFDSYRDATLSYIPSGSGNDFARSIHLSKNPKELLSSILTSDTPAHFDQGLCLLSKDSKDSLFPNGRKFTISCGIGFDAAICYEALNSRLKTLLNKIKLGKLTYALIALKQIISYPLTDAEVIIDGGDKKSYSNIFFIAGMNQPYEGGGFKMAPSALPNDGKLSVAVYYNMNKVKALCMLPAILLGIQSHFKGFDTFDCTQVQIKTSKPLVIHTDGEYAGTSSEVNFSIFPEQITYLR